MSMFRFSILRRAEREKMPKEISMTDFTAPKRKPTKPAKVYAGKKKKKEEKPNLVDVNLVSDVITIEDSGTAGSIHQMAPFLPNARTEVNEPLIVEESVQEIPSVYISQMVEAPTMNTTTTNVVQTPVSTIPFQPGFTDVVQTPPSAIPLTNIPFQIGLTNLGMQPPKIIPQCPIHFVEIVEKLSKTKEFAYFECPTNSCCLFTAKGEEDGYMYTAITLLSDSIKEAWRRQPLRCKCQKHLSLKRSRSEKNRGRLYLSCRWRECNYFQWGDLPLTTQNQDHHFNQNILTLTKDAETQTKDVETPCSIQGTNQEALKQELTGRSKQMFEEVLTDPGFLQMLSPPVLDQLKKNLQFLAPRKWYVEGPYFYDDGNYPDKIAVVDDGKNTIQWPPELAGLLWRQTAERKQEKEEEEAVKRLREVFPQVNTNPEAKRSNLLSYSNFAMYPNISTSPHTRFGGVPLAEPIRGSLF